MYLKKRNVPLYFYYCKFWFLLVYLKILTIAVYILLNVDWSGAGSDFNWEASWIVGAEVSAKMLIRLVSIAHIKKISPNRAITPTIQETTLAL
jgi:hypothetical protein